MLGCAVRIGTLGRLNFRFFSMRSFFCLVVVGLSAGHVSAQSPATFAGKAGAASLQAHGYNPEWALNISDGRLTLRTALQLQQPPPDVLAAAPDPVRTDGTLRYTTVAAQGALLTTFSPSACTDAIQGSVHPYQVDVRYAGLHYQGCGGDPVALLQGQEWVVEDIAARGIMDRSRITLQFGTSGDLGGRASCGPYAGRYALADGQLRLNATPPPAAMQTLPAIKICPPALRRQDTAFFEVLAAVSRWDFTADGALALGTVDGRRIVARRTN